MPNFEGLKACFVIIVVACYCRGLAWTANSSHSQEPTVPVYWRSFVNGTYITAFGGPSRGKLTYPNAKKFCAARNASLAILLTEELNDFLKSRFTTLYWVGLSYKPQYDTFKWEDDSNLTDSSVWLPKEPFMSSLFGANRSCGAIPSAHLTKYGVKEDLTHGETKPLQYLSLSYCNIPRAFICETAVEPPAISAKYQEDSGSWISLHADTLLGWEAASSRCRELGGTLLLLPSRSRSEAVFKALLHHGFWIGLVKIVERLNDYAQEHWEDGSVGDYVNWEVLDPLAVSLVDGVSRCTAYTEFTGKWFPQDCNTLELQFVCQSNTSEVEALSGAAGGATYSFFAQPASFAQAQAVCASSGSQLAVIGSWEEGWGVAQLAWRFLRNMPYYIGHTGSNQTVLGGSSQHTQYVDPGTVEGVWGQQGCVVVGWPERVGQSWTYLPHAWWPVNCSTPHAFVCKSGDFQVSNPAAGQLVVSNHSAVTAGRGSKGRSHIKGERHWQATTVQ